MRYYVVVFSQSGSDIKIPDDIYETLNTHGLGPGLHLAEHVKDRYGYLFGVYDSTKKKVHILDQLPFNTTEPEVRKKLDEIASGIYEEIRLEDEGGTDPNQTQTSVIPLDLGDSQDGGVLPFDILPDWLHGLLGKLKIPWWVFGLLATYTASKLLNKDSNKIFWGGLTLFLLLITLKLHSDSKKADQVKNA